MSLEDLPDLFLKELKNRFDISYLKSEQVEEHKDSGQLFFRLPSDPTTLQILLDVKSATMRFRWRSTSDTERIAGEAITDVCNLIQEQGPKASPGLRPTIWILGTPDILVNYPKKLQEFAELTASVKVGLPGVLKARIYSEEGEKE